MDKHGKHEQAWASMGSMSKNGHAWEALAGEADPFLIARVHPAIHTVKNHGNGHFSLVCSTEA